MSGQGRHPANHQRKRPRSCNALVCWCAKIRFWAEREAEKLR